MTDFWERFEPGTVLRLGQNDLVIEDATWQQGRLQLKLSGIDDVDAARAVQFQYLEGDADFAPQLDEDEFLSESLAGLDVFEEDGTPLGKVSDVMRTPAHDVLVVGEILVPAVKEFVRRVDLAEGKIVVRLIEGMKPVNDVS